MKGKSIFSKSEAESIIVLIKKKLKTDGITQKSIRNKIRALGFYASDFGLGGGYNVEDFLRVITIIPDNTTSKSNQAIKPILKVENPMGPGSKNNIKGLAPIVDQQSEILILGTMPGVESLRKQAYYGNDRNLFWKLMTEVTGKEVPSEYEARKTFLLENKIALWDVCQTCFREGSLDSAISGETPNEIISFLQKYPEIKAIALNGQTAEKLFAKYFSRIPGIEVFSMPSTSAANAGVKWETKVGEWGKIKKFLMDR